MRRMIVLLGLLLVPAIPFVYSMSVPNTSLADELNKEKPMALKAAFIFLSPSGDPQVNRGVVNTTEVEVITVAVKNYDAAEKVAVALVEEGVVAIELCGGFGHVGTARIVQAVKGKAAVGVVRFDVHPGLDGQSGDDLF